ncbi:ABC transporter substrate-binding protein [Paracraurococcus ruber]|nr:ABC transporter substrate-binding protein [Paracraurococcus ruber]TDG22550.1 ABC transporter substrate-binding protein [Paracraurococcus ruber]
MPAPTRRALLGAGALALTGAGEAAAQGTPPGTTTPAGRTVRIAMSIGDIPRLWGGPEAGLEGVRFGAHFVYDALVNWDLSSADRPSGLTPGLATAWRPEEGNRRRWIITLRRGVVFHDGTPFDADAAIWNFDSIFNREAPQFDGARAGFVRGRLPAVARAEKIDDVTIAVMTHELEGMLPYQLSFLWFVSPAHWRALGGDWARFAQNPSGTGPYKVISVTPRQRAELEANTAYWNPARIPKVPRTVLLPIPDANARVAALRAGQADVIESVPPDAIASLRAAGFPVMQNAYPHIWAWRLNHLPTSPFHDVRVRRAANLAIDREAMAALLVGSALPARGKVTPDDPWFGNPSFALRHDKAAARDLMQQAGYGPNRRCAISVIAATSGGGQILPAPMNEAIQADLREIWMDVTFQIVDFATIINLLRAGAKDPAARNAAAINVAIPSIEPATGWIIYDSQLVNPRGLNWGHYDNPAADAALRAVRAEFGAEGQAAAMRKLHEVLVDDAAGLYVVHDLNPRAFSPRVSGFVQARNWFQDYTPLALR